MRRARSLAGLLSSLAAMVVGSGPVAAQPRPGGSAPVVTITGPADHMVNGVLQLARGESLAVRASAISAFEVQSRWAFWLPQDSAIVTVEAGSQSAVPIRNGGTSFTWNAIARAHASGDTSILFQSDMGSATLRVHVLNLYRAPAGAMMRTPVPLLSRPTVAAPISGSAEPQGFGARYVGQGQVAFTWQPVAGAAGVAVYDARTGDQLSPLVPGGSWLSAPLRPGNYTFVAASWRSPTPGAPPVVSGTRSSPALVTVPIY